MAKLNAALAAMLILCSLLLVTSQHRARKAFIDLERAQTMARRHESRVDSMARGELRMQPVTPDRTLYLPRSDGAQ